MSQRETAAPWSRADAEAPGEAGRTAAEPPSVRLSHPLPASPPAPRPKQPGTTGTPKRVQTGGATPHQKVTCGDPFKRQAHLDVQLELKS